MSRPPHPVAIVGIFGAIAFERRDAAFVHFVPAYRVEQETLPVLPRVKPPTGPKIVIAGAIF